MSLELAVCILYVLHSRPRDLELNKQTVSLSNLSPKNSTARARPKKQTSM